MSQIRGHTHFRSLSGYFPIGASWSIDTASANLLFRVNFRDRAGPKREQNAVGPDSRGRKVLSAGPATQALRVLAGQAATGKRGCRRHVLLKFRVGWANPEVQRAAARGSQKNTSVDDHNVGTGCECRVERVEPWEAEGKQEQGKTDTL